MAKENKSGAKVPNLRFPGFEGEWDTRKLGEIMDFKVTNSFSRDNLNYESGTTKNIHYGDIHTKFQTLFDVTNEIVPFINVEIDVSRISNENYCREGDIIFADASEDLNDVGKSIEIINLNGERLLSGLHTLLARPNNGVFHLGFNGYLFKSNFVRTQIQRESQGSKVLSVNVGRISRIDLAFPSIQEQKKIADLLSLIDERIQTQNKIIEGLKSSRDTISKLIFSRKVRFKDDSGHAFPEWNVTKLRNISKIYDGTHQTPDYVADGVQFYSVENVTANQFNNTKYIAAEVYDKENKRIKLEKGDILMTRIGSIGVAKYIDWDVKASFYVSLALFKKSLNVNNEFLYHFIKTDFFQTELWKRTIHVAFPKKINLGEIGECLVKIPCSTEQDKIAKMLSTIESKIEFESELLGKMEFQKKYLLANLFI